MPVNPTYPGVYIDELPSAVRTITGVPTSIAAFAGWAPRGPADRPKHITSWADYETQFGGLHRDSPMSYAVYHFYLNGGSDAEIVRLVAADGAAASVTLAPGVPLTAVSPGAWGNRLRVRVDYDTLEDPATPDADRTRYNLTVRDTGTGLLERYLNVSIEPAHARGLDKVLATSRLLRVPAADAVLDQLPAKHGDVPPGSDPFADGHDGDWYVQATADSGADGAVALGVADYLPAGGAAAKTGLYQLLKTDIFNLLCLPGAPDAVAADALELCVDRRAVLLVDPPGWQSVDDATGAPPVQGDSAKNAAIYFPNVLMPDPLADGTLRAFPPSGVMAGVCARTDVQRGVWKAPAGTDASLNGVRGLELKLTDGENGRLNPLGVNCLREFPVVGTVSWGARTLRGADRLADQWKYLPVRRLALFIEESLFRGTQWVVFEPNDEPLWSSIRQNVGAFMNNLFRQGAFQGQSPDQAYLVKCDSENNPQYDIDRGIVNVTVGFAPLKPAEFVVIHIQQLAGQSAAG